MKIKRKKTGKKQKNEQKIRRNELEVEGRVFKTKKKTEQKRRKNRKNRKKQKRKKQTSG